MTLRNCVTVDFDTSSGYVILTRYRRECRSPTLHEIHRFSNGPYSQNGYVTWNVDSLKNVTRLGLNKVCEKGIRIDNIEIGTWGVDLVLLDQQGQHMGLPVAYHGSRTYGLMVQTQRQLGKRDIYQRSGIQLLPFNTIYQLHTLIEQQPELTPHIAHALLIPDYSSYRLTDKMSWEYINATITQLANISSNDWDESLLAWSDANKVWSGRPTRPGNVMGHWICPQGNEIPVVAVASHDTTSAVIALSLDGSHAAYLSSSIWSLMGFESQASLTNDTALAVNITNEGGAEGHYRVLKSTMGLWLPRRVLQERQTNDLPAPVATAQAFPAYRSIINPNDDRFINPDEMCSEVQTTCRETVQSIPGNDTELVRCIFDSLASLCTDMLHKLAQLCDKGLPQLHIVGGGCQNTLLNQLCADACGVRVIAGPVKASTLGNIGIQLVTLDGLNSVDDLRQAVSTTANLTTFTPDPDSEIAHYVAQAHFTRQTKELCI